MSAPKPLQTGDKTRWNSVTYGDSIYTVERAPELLAKIDLSLIPVTNAWEKHPHKQQCRNCMMYFEKTSVLTKVPNHRVIDYQRALGVDIKGTRYSTASYLYANSGVCVFCAQLFDSNSSKDSLTENKEKRRRDRARSKSPVGAHDELGRSGSVSGRGQGQGQGQGLGGSTSMSASMSMSQLDEPSVSSPFGSTWHGSEDRRAVGFAAVGANAHGGGDEVTVGSTESAETRSSFGATDAHKYNNNLDNDLEIIHNPKNGLKLNITTVIQRSNIAVSKRVYQSSEVDDMAAENAILVPYLRSSRTRREADPWWEIDFGRSHHLHSLVFDVMAQKAADIEAVVMLLSSPKGFEVPFLDRCRRAAVASEEFVIKQVPEKALQRVTWELPAGTECVAIRVQLRGILTLQLNEFKVYLGDNFVAVDAEASLRRTKDSYATLSPVRVQASLAAMLSPLKKRERTTAAAKRAVKADVFVDPLEITRSMDKLDSKVLRAYDRQESWRKQVLSCAKSFKTTEIDTIFEVLFKPCVVESLGKVPSPTSADAAAAAWPQNFLPRGQMYTGEASLNFHKEEMMGLQLMSHYPRCDLAEVHARLRAMLLMIQSFGNHPKPSWVGELQWNATVRALAEDPYDGLLQLKTAVGRLEEHWTALNLSYRDKHGNPRRGRTDPSVERGCSWSQFLVIFALFLDGKSELIPTLAFNIMALQTVNKSRPVTRELLQSAGGYGGYAKEGEGSAANSNNNGNSRASSANPDVRATAASEAVRSAGAGAGGGVGSSRAGTGAGAGAGAETGTGTGPRSANSRREGRVLQNMASLVPSTPIALDNGSALIPFKGSVVVVEGALKSDFGSVGFPGGVVPNVTPATMPLLNNARDPMIPPMDTRFSEYKLGNFKKRVNAEFVFPKSLTLEFTDMFLEDQKLRAAGKRPATVAASSAEENGGGDDAMSFTSGNTASASPSPLPLPRIAQGRPESQQEMGGASSSGNSVKLPEDYGADRTCSLCNKRYSYSATQGKVLFKHVISLRRHWDPALVSKDIQMLEQGTSMFNLMTVCGFCNQFFHPDFPNGIFFPLTEAAVEKQKPIIPDADKGPVQQNPFFDKRYPQLMPSGAVFQKESTAESRSNAKFAIEVARSLKAARREEEARVAAAVAMLQQHTPPKLNE